MGQFASAAVLEGALSAGAGRAFLSWFANHVRAQLKADVVVVTDIVADDWGAGHVVLALGAEELVGRSWVGPPWAVSSEPRLLDGLRRSHPSDPVVAHCDAEAALVLPLLDSAGRVLGLLIALAKQPYKVDLGQMTQGLSPFLPRAGAELEGLLALETLRALVDATTPRRGRDVFVTLVEAAMRVLHVDLAYVGQHLADKHRVTVLAMKDGALHVEPTEYDLTGTPCEAVYKLGERVFIPRDVTQAYPADEYLKKMGAQSYLGVPAVDSQGRVLGHLGLIHRRPLQVSTRADELFEILALRAGAELQFQREETERIAMERKLLGTQKLESLGVLAGGIAHDFNNLLVAILGNASLAMREVSNSSPIRQNLVEIENAARRAADLARQMLAYSGKGQFTMTLIDLSKLIEEMTNLLQVSIPKKVIIRYNLDHNLPAVLADATQLRQLVMNLVLNGADAIGEKSGVVSITSGRVRLDAAYLQSLELGQQLPEGDYVYMEVADTGCGMDAETMLKIFDPFFTTKARGRGLGLAAVHGIIRGHRGALKIYSEPRRGTTFKLLFPCAQGQAEQFIKEVDSDMSSLPGGLALVADDEDSVRAVAASMLEAMRYTVVQAVDGRQAIERFKERPEEFALVIIDMTMPHLGGVEVFRELRRIRPDLKVILMSGYNEEDATSVFAGKGLTGFLQKPFSLKDMQARVKAAFSGETRT